MKHSFVCRYCKGSFFAFLLFCQKELPHGASPTFLVSYQSRFLRTSDTGISSRNVEDGADDGIGSGDCSSPALCNMAYLKNKSVFKRTEEHSPTQRVKFDCRSENAGILESMDSTMNCDARCRVAAFESLILHPCTWFRYYFQYYTAEISQARLDVKTSPSWASAHIISNIICE